MSVFSAVYGINYAATANLTNGAATLTNTSTSGVILLGKNVLFQVNCKDTTTPGSITQLAFTFGLSTGTTAPAPTTTSPFWSVTQQLVFSTGPMYDSIQVGNFHNGTDSIDYSITILDRF